MKIHLILSALSALGSFFIYLFRGEGLSPAWLVPIFLGWLVALELLHLLSIPLFSLFLSREEKPEHPKPWVCAYIRYMMRWLMPLCNVRVVIRGGEKLPNGPCVIVSNHRSMFDPMVILRALPKRKIVFVSKIENFKIPIARKYFAHAGFLPIDRDNALKALRQIRRGEKMMQEDGVDVVIYPEGTRSKTGELLPFKAGAFMMAQRSKSPLVIMTTKNTERIAHAAPFRHTRVELEVLEVLTPDAIASRTLEELTASVYQRIQEAL